MQQLFHLNTRQKRTSYIASIPQKRARVGAIQVGSIVTMRLTGETHKFFYSDRGATQASVLGLLRRRTLLFVPQVRAWGSGGPRNVSSDVSDRGVGHRRSCLGESLSLLGLIWGSRNHFATRRSESPQVMWRKLRSPGFRYCCLQGESYYASQVVS